MNQPTDSGAAAGHTTTLAFVGAGALATALATACSGSGYHVRTVSARTSQSAQRLARHVGAEALPVAQIPHDVDALILCVPDDALSDAVAVLAARGRVDSVVVHTSGVSGVAAVSAVSAAGYVAFHPVQTFLPPGPVLPDPTAAQALFRGVYVGVEAQGAGKSFATRLVERLGAKQVEVPAALRPAYHAAAAIASNHLVAVLSLSDELLRAAGFDGPDGHELFGPLVRTTVANALAVGPERALSGPIVRGDTKTVLSHLQAVQAHAPGLTPVFVAATVETVRLAVRSGRLSADRASEMLAEAQAVLALPETKGT